MNSTARTARHPVAEGAGEHSLFALLEGGAEDADRIQEDLSPFGDGLAESHGIADEASDIEARSANDTLGVNGHPAALGVEEDVPVMEIAVQENLGLIRSRQALHHCLHSGELLKVRIGASDVFAVVGIVLSVLDPVVEVG